MTFNLDDLVVDIGDITRGKKITVNIHIDDTGVVIVPEKEKNKLTITELTCLTGMAFMYTALVEKGLVPNPDYIVRKGVELRGAMKRQYTELKRLEDMNMDEFNKEMKKYDGRGKSG